MIMGEGHLTNGLMVSRRNKFEEKKKSVKFHEILIFAKFHEIL